jgi:Icc-related predicted phosphoesterase
VRLLIIADDESLLDALPCEPADVLISCGDLPDRIILEAAERCSCRRIFAVKGNHDSSAEFPSPICDLHLETAAFENIKFGGFCGAWRYKPKGNFLFDQHEVNGMTAYFPPVDVFVAHNSPRGIHDREDEVHYGFDGFTKYIDRARPRFFLHGHQHLTKETERNGTRIVGVFGACVIEV